MIGHVDQLGRALVTIGVRANDNDATPIDVEAWIDTGFNGELVLPRAIIDAENLESSAGIEATLADGSTVMLETFSCRVEWFGEVRIVEVIANEGAFPLIGIALLLGHRLTVDYELLSVAVE